MSIVPESADLIVEARMAPTDVDQTVAGQPARMRFTAFNQRTTPEIHGVLETIGAAATLDATSGQTYYLSTIAIAGGIKASRANRSFPACRLKYFLQQGTDRRCPISSSHLPIK